ncbi:MAG: DUF2235 domain-containing protein [Pseudomonadota bacterium]
MAKNIIFCADGTWNKPVEEIDQDTESPSNVFKLFNLLAGMQGDSIHINMATGRISEYEKSYIVDTHTVQIAKYINGVGNSSVKLNRILGGAFGFGLIERIARGYTFISRNYVEGDKIFIAGFSRGAYTARALAGLIAAKGLLARKFNQGEAESYDMAVRAWYSYRAGIQQATYKNNFQNLLTAFTSIKNFLLQNTLSDTDFNQNIPVEAVAVWDTVGALGIPDFEFDDKQAEIRDGFAFADNVLSAKVKNGFHAVSLDEMRLLFTPTLWEKRDGIQQALFAGSHSDVGGGYKETGLSDCALKWMIDALSDKKLGVKFVDSASKLAGNPADFAHTEWAHLVGLTDKVGQRAFKNLVQNGTLNVHQSVLDRVALTAFSQYRNQRASPYKPNNY